MASIKVKFYPVSSSEHEEGRLAYTVSHKHRTRKVATPFRIHPTEWNDTLSMPVVNYSDPDKTDKIRNIRNAIFHDLERFNKIVRRLESEGRDYTADEIVAEYERYKSEYSLGQFMSSLIIMLRKRGKTRTSETYKATLNSFRSFLRSRCDDIRDCAEDLPLDNITEQTVEEYEMYLRNRGLTPNTSSFYMRILRAVYNRAVERGIIDQRSPFRHVYTGVEKTVKRAIPISVLRRIRSLDLSLTQKMDYARDMFMLSFYLRGMSLIDMAFLRKHDLKNGYVSYRRRKTGQQLVIKWTREMQLITDKYPENDSDYLLPIIRHHGTNEICTYRNAGYNINRSLKTIGSMAGTSIPLTMYCARHSWASAAKAKGVPLSVISEGMGHDSETTTKIYLASLSTSDIDRANSLIMAALK